MEHIKIKLSKKEKMRIDELLKETKSIKIARRFLCLRSLDDGNSKTQTAKLFGVCIETLHAWLLIYQSDGVDGLNKLNYEGRRKSVLEQHKEKLEEYIRSSVVIGYTQLTDFVNNELGVALSYFGVRDFLKKKSMLS